MTYAVKLPNASAVSIQDLCANLQGKSASQVPPERKEVEVPEEDADRKVRRGRRDHKASWALLVDMASKALWEFKE